MEFGGGHGVHRQFKLTWKMEEEDVLLNFDEGATRS